MTTSLCHVLKKNRRLFTCALGVEGQFLVLLQSGDVTNKRGHCAPGSPHFSLPGNALGKTSANGAQQKDADEHHRDHGEQVGRVVGVGHLFHQTRKILDLAGKEFLNSDK